MNRLFTTALCLSLLLASCGGKSGQEPDNQPVKTNNTMEEQLILTQEWDKVFPQSNKVNHTKITFHNRYGITLAADLYIPKDATDRLPAIAVCGPFGAVKEH